MSGIKKPSLFNFLRAARFLLAFSFNLWLFWNILLIISTFYTFVDVFRFNYKSTQLSVSRKK